MVDLGSGSQREVDDLMLTRYARYLKMRSLLTAAGRGPTQSPFLLPPGKL
jgi:hypothetical protein